jgi:hypothetical protein
MTLHRARAASAAAAYRARMAARRRMLAPLLLMIAAACGSHPKSPAQEQDREQEQDPVPNLDAGLARQWQPRPAIVQTLRLLNPGLHEGDTLKLESTLKNVSSQPVDISYVNCELDLEGELQTMSPLIYCFAYSMDGTLAPGEEVTGHLNRVIASPPGRYRISIRHLLKPAVSVPAELTVYPR